MLRKVSLSLVVLVLLTASVANGQTGPGKPAASAQRVNKERFAAVYRAAKTLQAATEVGVNYVRFGELLAAFATELNLVADKRLSTREQVLLGLYDNALMFYQQSQSSLDSWNGGVRAKAWSYAEQVGLGPANKLYLKNVVSKEDADQAGGVRVLLTGDQSRVPK